MEKLLNKFDDILEELKRSPKYQDLLAVKKQLADNEEIKSLISEIKDLQKSIVKKEAEKKSFAKDEKIYLEKLNLLNSIPLYQEYSYLLDDIQVDLEIIRSSIEKEINKLTN